MFLKKILKFVMLKIKFARKCKFDFSCKISIHSEFEGMNKLHKSCSFDGFLGYGSYIGPNSRLHAKVGRFCSISGNVVCNNGIHPFQYPFVSTAPCFYSMNPNHTQNGSTFATKQLFEEYKYIDNKKKYAVEIENDVWICEGVFINGGVRIANGAVVLAHAVVTKDVPPYAIVGGVPARIVGYRYDEGTINWLLSIKWWENDAEWFKANWRLMADIDKMKDFYKK